MVCTGHNYVGIFEEKFEAFSFVRKRAQFSRDQEINVTLVQITMQRIGPRIHKMKHNARMALQEPIDNGRDKAGTKRRDASDPNLASTRIG